MIWVAICAAYLSGGVSLIAWGASDDYGETTDPVSKRHSRILLAVAALLAFIAGSAGVAA